MPRSRVVAEAIACLAVSTLGFLIWWWPYISRGAFPLAEWGNSLIWADWMFDRNSLVDARQVAEWNPFTGFGENYIARDGFNNALSLGNIFKFFFKNPASEWVFGFYFFLQTAALGVFCLLRKERVTFGPALAGAVLFVLLPKWLDDGYHGPGKFVGAYALMPWAIILIRATYAQSPRIEHHLGLGVLAALIYLSSGAWVTSYVAYMLVAYYVLAWTNYLQRAGFGAAAATLYGPALSAAVAIGLSAYLLLPLLEGIGHVQRSLYAQPSGYGLDDIVGMVFPWLNRVYTDLFYDYPLGPNFSHFRSFFGILAIPLFLICVLDPVSQRRFAFFWVFPLAIAFLYSKVGNVIFPVTRLFEQFLGAQSSENFLFIPVGFCVAVTCAAGLDRLLASLREMAAVPRIRSLVIVDYGVRAVCAVYFALALAWLAAGGIFRFAPGLVEALLRSVQPSLLENITLNVFVYSYFFTGIFFLVLLSFVLRGAALYWLSSALNNKLPRALATAWIPLVLIAGDLLTFPYLIYPMRDDILTVRFGPGSDQNRFVVEKLGILDRAAAPYPYQKMGEKAQRMTDQVAAERAEPGRSPRFDPVRIAAKLGAVHAADRGYVEALLDVGVSYYPLTVGKSFYNSHISLLPDYFYDFDAALNGAAQNYYRQSWLSLWDPSSRLVDAAAITHVFWHLPLSDPRYELVARDPIGDVHIYRNKNAAPRFGIVHRGAFWQDRTAMLAHMASADFDARRELVTEDKVLADWIAANAREGTSQVALKSFGFDEVFLDVRLEAPGVLVDVDLFYPHWSATIDGKQAPIHRVNAAFRGIPLPAGSHTVVLSYRNPGFHLGLKITAVTATSVVVLFALLFFLRMRRGRGTLATTTA